VGAFSFLPPPPDVRPCRAKFMIEYDVEVVGGGGGLVGQRVYLKNMRALVSAFPRSGIDRKCLFFSLFSPGGCG